MAVGSEPLVVWINGAFGFGKTAVAAELLSLMPRALLFDPHVVVGLPRDIVPPTSRLTVFRTSPRDARWRGPQFYRSPGLDGGRSSCP